METVLRASAIGLLCAVAALVLRPQHGEMRLLVGLGGSILLLSLALPALGQTLGDLKVLFEGNGMERYATAMLRAVGIGVLTRLSSDVCRDVGESGVASGVEMTGKVAILTLCLPMLREILGYAARLLEQAE